MVSEHTEHTDVAKLASVLNTTGQQGKADFVRMLWKNQPADVQSQLMPLLNDAAQQAVQALSESSGS